MIKKCLFPAAGYGTRFLPASKAVPKEMLPILTKPLLQYGVEEALSAGITNMAIVTGRGKRAIEDHFDNSFELESQLQGTAKEHYLYEIKDVIQKSTFTYVRQQKMLGLGHAILTGEPLIGEEPFAVLLADDLVDCKGPSVLEQMLIKYNKYKCSIIAIQEIPKESISNYGIVNGDLVDNSIDTFRIHDMVEKPIESNSNLAIIGRYILTPDIFDILKKIPPNKDGEIQITDALLIQAKMGNVIGVKFNGDRFDCGSIDGFIDATNHFAKKLEHSLIK
ncbi:UTP--glucose-1-phosphate uridylyltransferase GalU [Pseudothioglobus sp. nBUS_23]|uniref:UTP--glucose-1-phosphate uridylyltransferase GalU n=1 Tax=Pseudothioglobus sp. nBUS_23 TaxID=3395318 RepID=UPI003EB945E0